MLDAIALARDAALIKADTLEPHQHPTSRGLKTAVDFRQQWMLKHPHLSEFHSRAEHLHAALLEGEPRVNAYVPQPFRLRIGRRLYTPDCYVASEGAPRRVVELKPGGVMRADLQMALTQFFAQHRLQFEVVSAEAVLARETEADNWVEIVRILHQARALGTEAAEATLLETLFAKGPCTLGDLIDAGDRERTYHDEIALLRLLHRGYVGGALAERKLDFDTGVWLCD